MAKISNSQKRYSLNSTFNKKSNDTANRESPF